MDISAIRAWCEVGETERAARAVYDALPEWRRPGWAADVLELACTRLTAVPAPVRAVIEIGRSRWRLHTAHAAFSAVRDLTLGAGRGGEYAAVLSIAEDAAKVIYNASGAQEPVSSWEPAPFDDECGYFLVSGLSHLAQTSGSPDFARAAWAVHESWLGPSAGRRRAAGPRGKRPWWRFWERRPNAAEPPAMPERRGPSF